jgi:hypothetical protein
MATLELYKALGVAEYRPLACWRKRMVIRDVAHSLGVSEGKSQNALKNPAGNDCTVPGRKARPL